jgi:2-polyprenyl-3-methyl-5-hydroxy-6-metoxy-1,4-benzoquinol methylase
MSHETDRRALQEDQERLRRMLELTVGRVVTAGREPLLEQPDVSILDIACGACDEAATLTDYFHSLRSAHGSGAPVTRLIGTDVRERELDDARARFRSEGGRSFEFFRSDASRLDDHRSLPGAFDVVFFRHQNLYHGRALWERIFDQGLAKLSDDGLLVVTSYFDREHDLALQALQKLGAEVLVTRRNPLSRELTTAGKSVDRHVAVLRKKAGSI